MALQSFCSGYLASYVRTRNIIFEARLFWFMVQIKEGGILHLKRACFALRLIEREEHNIWSALNDSKIGGKVTRAKWRVTVQCGLVIVHSPTYFKKIESGRVSETLGFHNWNWSLRANPDQTVVLDSKSFSMGKQARMVGPCFKCRPSVI